MEQSSGFIVTTQRTTLCCLSRLVGENQGIFIATAGTEQPLLTYALLYLQDRFTLSNLNSVGQILGVIEPGKKPTKKKTLEALATHVGDCNFIEQVLYRAECGKQKEDHIAFEGEADMLSCLLEQLDKDEQEEYKSLKKKPTEENQLPSAREVEAVAQGEDSGEERQKLQVVF